MTKQIDSTARIERVRLEQQGSDPASPASGYWYFYVKSGGVYAKNAAGTVVGPFLDAASAVAALDDLTDVTITTPTTAQTLRYNGSAWVNAALGHGDLSGVSSDQHHNRAHNLASATDHPDVVITSPADNEVLTYDSGTSKWTNQAAGSGTDGTAIHDDASGEIAAITEKVTPVDDDLLLIEDSAAANAKKRLKVSNLPKTVQQAILTFEGTLSVVSGVIRIYNNFGATKTISKVMLSANTAPTGASIIVDVNLNGTTIFTTQANRPALAAGANTGDSTSIDVTAWADGDYLQADIDQIGSTIAGADLTVHIVFS